jgi:hypothetical protein
MKFKIQLITQCETGEAIQELACLERETESIEAMGITLAEAKALLSSLQKQVVEQQLEAYLAVRHRCPHCAQAFRHKGQHPVVFHTLFGNLAFASPRWFQCPCQPHETRTFSPLAELLTDIARRSACIWRPNGPHWSLLILPPSCSKTYCPSKPAFTPPVYAIICNAWRNGQKPGLAESKFSLSTAARGSGRRYRDRPCRSRSGSMAVMSGIGITRRPTLK